MDFILEPVEKPLNILSEGLIWCKCFRYESGSDFKDRLDWGRDVQQSGGSSDLPRFRVLETWACVARMRIAKKKEKKKKGSEIAGDILMEQPSLTKYHFFYQKKSTSPDLYINHCTALLQYAILPVNNEFWNWITFPVGYVYP